MVDEGLLAILSSSLAAAIDFLKRASYACIGLWSACLSLASLFNGCEAAARHIMLGLSI